jgi:hypothetical protein
LKNLFHIPEIRVWVKEIEVMKLQHNRHAAENLTPYRTIDFELKAIRWPPQKTSCLLLWINGVRILFRILAQNFCVPQTLIAYAAKGLPSAITSRMQSLVGRRGQACLPGFT